MKRAGRCLLLRDWAPALAGEDFSEEPNLLETPNLNRPPQLPLFSRQDQPQGPIPHRLRGIALGRHRRPARMRMIMPDHPRPASPRPPIRRKQRNRIDLERPRRLGRHVRASLSRIDPPPGAEQQPAHLATRRIFRLGQQPAEQSA